MFPGSNKDDREYDGYFFFFFKVTLEAWERGANSKELSAVQAPLRSRKERPGCLPSLPFKKGSFAKEFCEMSCLFISG